MTWDKRNIKFNILIFGVIGLIGLITTVEADSHRVRLDPTPSAAEGPYWKPNSPQKSTLYSHALSSKRIEVTGNVLEMNGSGIPGAKIDIWQTDDKGDYDNSGYSFRGHIFSDDSGQYRFRTVLPGEYPGRTRHIHIKVIAPDGRVLTTQLYFPEYSNRNNRDFLYDNRLVVNWKSKQAAAFDFVLPAL